ncbi:MAG: cellulase family glycosylhydrolase [Candidatus Zixiibacteriota bacterium]
MKTAFWTRLRHGANCFNHVVTADWWRAAGDVGIEVVRLAPNKWDSRHRDFLLGDADQFTGLITEDLGLLLASLAQADSVGMKVVVTTLSLPGARWRQQNGDRSDLRLWRDTSYWGRAYRFWRELAGHLKDNPAVVGYNILNEPTPEFAVGADGPVVLNRFYATVVRAIRDVDSTTPIVLDGGRWASPDGLAEFRPLLDTNVIYAFHMYEPFEYTNKKANAGRFSYPGTVVTDGGDTIALDRSFLELYLGRVSEW